MVIIIGLYIILWGKSKDHKILSPSKDEQAIISPKKILSNNENKLSDNKDNLSSQNNVVINIKPLKETIVSNEIIECCC